MSAAPNRGATPGAVRAVRASARLLDQESVYMTPTGRLCRLVALDGRGGVEPIARLEYVNAEEKGQRCEWGEGFNLRPENWQILTRVG